jgi:hypothetical protein
MAKPGMGEMSKSPSKVRSSYKRKVKDFDSDVCEERPIRSGAGADSVQF